MGKGCRLDGDKIREEEEIEGGDRRCEEEDCSIESSNTSAESGSEVVVGVEEPVDDPLP